MNQQLRKKLAFQFAGVAPRAVARRRFRGLSRVLVGAGHGRRATTTYGEKICAGKPTCQPFWLWGPLGAKREAFLRARQKSSGARQAATLGYGGAVPGLACGRCRASRRGPGAPHTAGPVPKVRTFVQRLSSVLGVTFSRHCSRQRRKGGQQALSVSLVVKKKTD